MAGQQAQVRFGLSQLQLVELMMSQRGTERMETIAEYGGIEGIAGHLRSSIETGASNNSKELKARKKEYGRNSIMPIPSVSFVAQMFIAVRNKTLIILIVAGLLSIVLGLAVDEKKFWSEGTTILVAVFIAVIVIAIIDWRAEQQFRRLQETDARFSVLREGNLKELPVAELVVGDIAQFKYSDTFPVDGILMEGFDVKVDESALTGESVLVKKDVNSDPMLYAGTKVMEGEGKMLVMAVGQHSQQGAMFALMQQYGEEEEAGIITQCLRKMRDYVMGRGRGGAEASATMLQRKLNKLAIQIGYVGTVAAILCILILILRYVIVEFGIDERSWDSSRDFAELVHFVIVGIMVIVVALPRGLPLAIRKVLVLFVRKMLKNGGVVRHLNAGETIGKVTSICSEKTGILTTNRFTVVESYLAGTRYEVTPNPADLPDNLLEMLKLNIAINSSYSSMLVADGEEKEEQEKKGWVERAKARIPWLSRNAEELQGQSLAKQVGNITECALLEFLMELGIDYKPTREAHPTANLTKVFPFNSTRKAMTTVLPLPGGGYRMLTKGASKAVLERCSSIMVENGHIQPLSANDREEITTTVVQSMASNALRTICLAYKDSPPAGDGITVEPDWDDEESVNSELTCVGIVGIQEPVRPEVPECIRKCQAAGITVRMMTGDNVETARAIAEKCGIVVKGDSYLVIDSSEFNRRISGSDGEVSQEKMDQVWPRLRVLARSNPQDKYTLVDGIIFSQLHKSCEVVAVTGSGTRDAPALKRADVGIAMGTASDVAKEASDMILNDSNFATVVKAVQWGRNVYDSISKFFQFQLTVYIVAVSFILISAISIGDSPLRTVQLLWIIFITDILASLALTMETPTEELLKRKPHEYNTSIVSRYTGLFLGGHSLYQLIAMLILVFAGPVLFDIDDGAGRESTATPTEHFTIVFNTFVFFQIFNKINARKVHGERNVFSGIHQSYILLAVLLGQSVVQVFIVEFGGSVFCTSGLPLDLWLWCVFLGSTELIVGQLLLLIPVNKIPQCKKSKEESDFDLLVDPLEETDVRVEIQIPDVTVSHPGLESGSNIHHSHLPHDTSTPHPQYTPIAGKETVV